MLVSDNECDIDVAEALRWIVDQPDVNVVMGTGWYRERVYTWLRER